MEKYKRYQRNPVIEYPQREWPNKQIEKAPIWCSVDLRDGNQALIDPMIVEEKIELFKMRFEDQAFRVVLNDSRFKSVYEDAKNYKDRNDLGQAEEAKISDAMDAMRQFAAVATFRNKDGSLAVKSIVSNWVEALMTNEKKSSLIDEEYSLEALLKTATGEFMHPCAARFVLYQLIEKFQEKAQDSAHITAEQDL